MDSPASRTDNELHHTTVFVDFSHLDAIPSKKASVEIPESATYNNDRPMATSIAAASKGDLQSSEATIPGLDLAAAARRRRRTAAGKRIAAFVWRCFAAAGLRALGRAARAIQRMWAANKSRIMKQRCLRFTMNGLISMETSQKIFAQLLGIRVRRLARSDRTKQAKVAISELSAVLNDIPTSSRSASDTAFARSISSQIRHLRLSVWNFFFEYSIWRTLPPPGYWLVGVPAPKLDAALTISTARITPSLAHVPNVARNVGISPKEYTAPKGTRPATAPSDGAAHKISGIMERQNENAQSNGVSASTAKKGPVTLAAFIQKSSGGKLSEAALPLLTNQSATTIIDERPLTGLGGGRAIFTAMAAASDLLLRKSSPTAVHGGKSHEIGAITAPAKNIGNTAKNNNAKVRSAGSSENKPSFEIQSLREPTSGPFIDLWVSSASRLMPASRGKVPKDTFGAPIPDRMPSVRVVLSMPKSIGSQEMKKSATYKLDHNAHTLNPEWNWHVKLPLPLLSGMSLLDGSSLNEASCKAHFKYWGCGAVHIEIVDIDRFNENIFMGETIILLSNLLGPIRDIKNPIKIAGEFILAKRSPADRVSGSVAATLSISLTGLTSKVKLPGTLQTPPEKNNRDNTSHTRHSPGGSIYTHTDSIDRGKGLPPRRLYSPVNTAVTDAIVDPQWASPASSSPIISDQSNFNEFNNGQPVLSGKLSQRIGLQKKKGRPDALINPSTNEDNLSLSVVSPLMSRDPIKPDSSEKVKERRPLYVSRSSASSASFRLAQVTQQLQGLEAALKNDADAALGNMYRRLDEIATPPRGLPTAVGATVTDSCHVPKFKPPLGPDDTDVYEITDHDDLAHDSAHPYVDSMEHEITSEDELIVLRAGGHHKQRSSEMDPTVMREFEILSREIGTEEIKPAFWHNLNAKGELFKCRFDTAEEDLGDENIVYAPQASTRFAQRVASDGELLPINQNSSYDIDEDNIEECEAIAYRGKRFSSRNDQRSTVGTYNGGEKTFDLSTEQWG